MPWRPVIRKALLIKLRSYEPPVTKIYPPREAGYTKMTPWVSWWSILRPIILLGLRIKKGAPAALPEEAAHYSCIYGVPPL
jgi:hypothetical protein